MGWSPFPYNRFLDDPQPCIQGPPDTVLSLSSHRTTNNVDSVTLRITFYD